MLFLTYWFVLFACVVYPLYWLVPVRAVRLAVLLSACAVFHTHFAGPAGVLPIAVLAVLTYAAGLTRSRTFCSLVIAACVLALVFYKYTTFLLVEVVGAVRLEWRDSLGGHLHDLLPSAPPLAISFFVFEFVHYLADVCRGSPSIKSPLHFGAYAIFWPSIVAGPVKRYQDFLPAYKRGLKRVCAHDVAVGLVRVAVGLVKKVVADNLTAWLTYWGPHFDKLDVLWRWYFIACLSTRVLLDFSGYSDMAIGFARMHGIVLAENFRWPYLARDLASFWQRWHISLSTWIRDYVYIPLGGSRCGPVRKALNGLAAFALCGFWHGASWNCLAWGIYNGIGLTICSTYRRLLGRVGDGLATRFERYPQVAWALTLLYVGIGMLIFFYPVERSLRMMGLLLGGTGS
ncbi:MAG: MBOAT family protein [Planctomycetes bacterium]|nr:MBOAT family protein [Planctomycetota bacterium]